MSLTNLEYDVLTIGRSSIDLYSNDIGAPFHEIKSFNAYVGGSSTNIAVGCARLGLKSALLSAVGKDKVGDFILHFLKKEKVETRYIFNKPQARTSAVLLGIQPPDTFPLVYYRENAADIQLTTEDVQKVLESTFRAVVLSGTAFSREPSRSAALFAAREFNQAGVKILLDLDYRHDQWASLADYQSVIREVLPLVHIILGTREEVISSGDAEAVVSIKDQQISAPDITGNLEIAIQQLQLPGLEKLILKSGKQGAFIYEGHSAPVHVPGFEVEVLNVLGAGDAFASGFLFGLLNNWDTFRSVRLGNACGAIIVTRHGCSNFNPFFTEVMEFAKSQGGL